MKKHMLIVLIAAVVSLTLPGLAMAGVDINISIPLFDLLVPGPPVVYAPAPPVYYAPQPVEGAVLYGGYWYRPSNGNWFVAAQVGGPWSMIAVESVPYAVISGPVLMHRAPSRGYGRVGVGVGIAPWYGRGWQRRGYGHYRDD
jgi:hypothetical protein